MRALTYFFILTVSISTSSAQELFQRVYGGESYDYGTAVIQTPDDGFLIAGGSGSYDEGFSAQVLIMKTDKNGYLEWEKTHGGTYADQAESMNLTTDGNLIVGGFTEVVGKSYQAYALKLNMNGDTIWTRSYGGDQWEFCREVVSLPDGGFALFGQTHSYGAGEGDFYLIRTDANGDTLWTKTYGGPAFDSGESIAPTLDGGFFLAGYTESFGAGGKDMYVVRTDAFGDTVWTKTFGGPEDDFCYGIAATDDDGYVIAGGTFNNTPGKSDYIVIRDGGLQQWVRHDPHSGDNYWLDVMVEPIGNITAVGYFTEGGEGQDDARIIRIGAEGTWNGVARGYGSHDNDRAYDVKLTSDFGYVFVGHTQGFLERFEDVYLVKTDNLGISVGPELGVGEAIVGERSYEVRIGPNPFSNEEPRLFVQDFQGLRNQIAGPISLRIHNAVGQLVLEQSVNSDATVIDSEKLKSGMYSYQLVSKNIVLATGVVVSMKE